MSTRRTARATVIAAVSLISFCLFAILWTPPCLGTTYVVTNTNDNGPGSLRQAILDANTNIGNDDIAFNIPGSGPHTISPLTDLPSITGTTDIDGWTQGGPGYTGPPLVEIEGSQSSGGNNQYGIDIMARNCLIRGLVLNRWSYQIHLFGDDLTGVANAGACEIQGNYIGLDVAGTSVPLPTGSAGIAVYWSDNNIIGGPASEFRNIITGNYYEIWINGANASGNIIRGNYIGTDVTGMNDPYTYGAEAGVYIWDGTNNQIGGNGYAGEYNLISASWSYGIYVTGSHAKWNHVQGNAIGTDITGVGPLGNGCAGILFTDQASRSIVGGIGTGELNLIAFNGQETYGRGGVIIEDGCVSIGVSSNQIHDNGYGGDLGIDLGNDGVTQNDSLDIDAGPNTLLNYPALNSFATVTGTTCISGTMHSTPNTLFALEFFSNQFADGSGYGEGHTFLGLITATTDGSGNAPFEASFGTEVPDNYCITATATNVDSCTSEFSAAAYYVDMVLTGTRAANQHILEWTDVPGTYEYWVFGASNDAYFDPDMATPYSNRLAVVPDGTLTWSTTNGIGDTANNWTYQVISVDGYGEEFARSNRVGEHDVALP